MIILFANQKGGVGKSTLSVLFSNYLTLAKNKPVKVYDMDFQRSLYNKAQAAEVIENTPLYPVEAAELSQFAAIRKKARLYTWLYILTTKCKAFIVFKPVQSAPFPHFSKIILTNLPEGYKPVIINYRMKNKSVKDRQNNEPFCGYPTFHPRI